MILVINVIVGIARELILMNMKTISVVLKLEIVELLDMMKINSFIILNSELIICFGLLNSFSLLLILIIRKILKEELKLE